jgi:phosphoglycolate phosphatase
MPNVCALLIDLDGTLMDTAPDLAEAVNRMREDLGMSRLSEERIACFIGKGAPVLVHRALSDDMDGRCPEVLHAKGIARFRHHYHELNGTRTVIYDGVPQALATLRETHLRLACVTNKPREFTIPLLERLGMAPFFAEVVAGDDVREPKPHPALLLKACANLDLQPVQVLMIGDSFNDARAAQAAGMKVVLVETGYNEGESLQSFTNDPTVLAVVPGLLDAVGWLLASGYVRSE